MSATARILPDRLGHLADQFCERARLRYTPESAQITDEHLREYLRDAAASLREFAEDARALKSALADAEAERIALADRFREDLEAVGMPKTKAALYVQEIIDSAKERA